MGELRLDPLEPRRVRLEKRVVAEGASFQRGLPFLHLLQALPLDPVQPQDGGPHL